MKKLYVVIGVTGEYSSRDEWPVCAYEDETLAKEHVTRAEEEARLRKEEVDHTHNYTREDDPTLHDPYFKMQYTGTRYFYAAVPLREQLPEVSA